MAGHSCPREQYEHIRQKFQDTETLKNTALNLVRAKSAMVSEPCGEPSQAGPAIAEPAAPDSGAALDPGAAPRTGCAVLGHRRSVSFELDLSAAERIAVRVAASGGDVPRSPDAEPEGPMSDELRRMLALRSDSATQDSIFC